MRYKFGILLITSFLLNADILFIMRDKNDYPVLTKKISSLFKNEKISISTPDGLQEINIEPTLIFCTEEKIINNFPEKFLNIPTILFYIKDPLVNIKMNMTGIWYVVPPSTIFSFLNSIGFSGKKVITIVPEGEEKNSYLEHAERVSESFSISLEVIEIKKGGIEEIKEKIKEADLIWIFPNKITTNPAFFKYLLRLTIEQKKPVLGYSQSAVEQGCVFGIEVSDKNYEKQIDEFLKKVKERKNPSTLPLQYPDEFNYYYNPRMAQTLDLKFDFSRFYGEIKYIRK